MTPSHPKDPKDEWTPRPHQMPHDGQIYNEWEIPGLQYITIAVAQKIHKDHPISKPDAEEKAYKAVQAEIERQIKSTREPKEGVI